MGGGKAPVVGSRLSGNGILPVEDNASPANRGGVGQVPHKNGHSVRSTVPEMVVPHQTTRVHTVVL